VCGFFGLFEQIKVVCRQFFCVLGSSEDRGQLRYVSSNVLPYTSGTAQRTPDNGQRHDFHFPQLD
jgi:hypothetical protein